MKRKLESETTSLIANHEGNRNRSVYYIALAKSEFQSNLLAFDSELGLQISREFEMEYFCVFIFHTRTRRSW